VSRPAFAESNTGHQQFPRITLRFFSSRYNSGLALLGDSRV
jgi:hypothetical protein